MKKLLLLKKGEVNFIFKTVIFGGVAGLLITPGTCFYRYISRI